MKILAALVFLFSAATGIAQEKNTNNTVTAPQPQQLQNNGLNNTRSNKEQRYAPSAPAPGSASPVPAETPVPDTNKVVPETPAGKPMAKDVLWSAAEKNNLQKEATSCEQEMAHNKQDRNLLYNQLF